MNTNQEMETVSPALTFLENATKTPALSARLEKTSSHQEVIAMAAEQGQKVTRESLAEAMKILVDRSLAREGVPSWVRARVYAPVHD
jgi:hypothetical protein